MYLNQLSEVYLIVHIKTTPIKTDPQIHAHVNGNLCIADSRSCNTRV